MAKTKYIFNDESLSYEKAKTTSLQRFFKILLFLITATASSFVIIFVSYTFFESPKERILKSEVSQYKLQYQIMNERLNKLENIADEMSDRDDNIYRIIFEAEPIPKSVRQAGYGGIDRYLKLEGYNNSEILISTAKKLDNISSSFYVQSKSFDEVYEMARNKEEMLACIPAIQPISNKELKRLSSFYGNRIDPIYKVEKFHSGVDFSAPRDTPIYASGAGTISRTRHSKHGYGNSVTIDHGFGYSTFYAHIRKIKVKKGDKVIRGQVIATVGNTGKSTAPHLHYEVRKNDRTVNPIYYFFNDLSPAEFDKVINLSKQPNQSLD